MVKETKTRSLVKTLSWRLTGSFVTSLIVYFFTQKTEIALAVGGFELVSKFLVYFVHERAWNKITWGRKPIKPAVIWLTGLSGAGKTTLGTEVAKRLKQSGHRVEHLDGDALRKIFPQAGFSRKEREFHVERVGHLASCLERQGTFVIASLISPYQNSRQFVRGICENFYEVHIDTPLEICEKRDSKGLYKRARLGDLENFTGIDDPYEMPSNPELVLRLEQSQDFRFAADKIIKDITQDF